MEEALASLFQAGREVKTENYINTRSSRLSDWLAELDFPRRALSAVRFSWAAPWRSLALAAIPVGPSRKSTTEGATVAVLARQSR